MDFTEFGLDERLMKGIEAAGYVSCTPVQEQVIKASKNCEGTKGPDLYVQSQTGTGKTAAYLIAVIGEMLKDENAGKKCLILAPTRELAVQIEEEAKTLAGASGLKAFSVYGGVGYEKQISMLKKGVDIIIGTPGRVIDLQEGGNLVLTDAKFCVIDEADRMFDMGFYPDLRKILKCLPEAEERQTMLFSATLNSYVKNLAWEYTRDPVEITIEAENITVSEISQELLHVSSDEKMKLLIGIIRHENPESLIIFCNTKRTCEVVAKRLCMNDLKADFLIGDLPQSKRLQILKAFKAGKCRILVATDVAARGIDVDDLAMVINFDLPVEAENYVHRIGRTARAGKSGKAYTFCSEQDVYSLPAIERYIEMSIPAVVAYPEQMEEDKSAGVYIKLDDWHGDDSFEHGSRKGRYGDRKDGRKNYRDRDGKKDYQKDGKKSGGKKNGGRKDDFRKGKKPYMDADKLAEMSYEERMKFYREMYGNSANSSVKENEGKVSDKKYASKKDGGKNSDNKGKNRNGNSKNYGSKNANSKNANSKNANSKNANSKNANSKNANSKNFNSKNFNAKKHNGGKNIGKNNGGNGKMPAAEKKSLWQKVKSLFAKK